MTTMKPKNTENINIKTRLHKLIIPTLLIVQLIAIGAVAFYADHTRQRIVPLEGDQTKTLIIDAIDGLTNEPAIDPKTGEVYIYEERLVLPPKLQANPHLGYFYTSGDDEAKVGAEIRLIDMSNLGQAKAKVIGAMDIEKTFEAVPKLQACSRAYQLTFAERVGDDMVAGTQKVFEKKLKDGRTIYVYLEDSCSENKDKLIPYLQQVESY